MRRMNFDRFAKPTNFGEWDDTSKKFVLDKPLEDGWYAFDVVVTEDDEYHAPGIIKIVANDTCYSSLIINYDNDGTTCLLYIDNKLVYGLENIATSNVIYLYKLD